MQESVIRTSNNLIMDNEYPSNKINSNRPINIQNRLSKNLVLNNPSN